MDGILNTIWKDYLCRIAARPCPKPFNDGPLARAAASPYRPGTIPPRLFSLQPGSTPEGIRSGLIDSEAYPDPQSPPAIPPGAGIGGALPSPVKTSEIDQDEFRVPGTITGPGLQPFFPAQLSNDIDVLEMAFVALGATSIQIFRDGSPITAVWPLAVNEKWSAPGLTVVRSQGLSAFITAAVSVNFEVRWKWRTNAP